MLNDPMKLLAVAVVASVVVGTGLSIRFDAPVQAAAGGRSELAIEAKSSWFDRWFGGMTFNGPKDRALAPAAQPETVQSAMAPVSARASGFGTVALDPDRSGQYHAQIEIAGQIMPMLVDTGATLIALRHEDAALLGLHPLPGEFNVQISTANGELKAARTVLREVRLDNITVTDVDAVIMPEGALARSLLGMSFLKKLSGFEIASGQLLLKP